MCSVLCWFWSGLPGVRQCPRWSLPGRGGCQDWRVFCSTSSPGHLYPRQLLLVQAGLIQPSSISPALHVLGSWEQSCGCSVLQLPHLPCFLIMGLANKAPGLYLMLDISNYIFSIPCWYQLHLLWFRILVQGWQEQAAGPFLVSSGFSSDSSLLQTPVPSVGSWCGPRSSVSLGKICSELRVSHQKCCGHPGRVHSESTTEAPPSLRTKVS